MDGAGGVRIEIAHGLGDVARAEWDSVANPANAVFDPFLTWDFLEALERAGCVSPEAGWAPRHLLLRDGARLIGAMPLYLKAHSYGEYVFDHAWADALHRAGGRYYPKLLSAVPFTPVTGRRVLGQTPAARASLLTAAIEAAHRYRASSLHINFAPHREIIEAEALKCLPRSGVQFHWSNPGFGSFQDFLAMLSSSKRKSIRKERERANLESQIVCKRGAEIYEADWDFFFRCYQDTGARKWGNPYLNREFFSILGERLADRLVLFIAKSEGRPIASALNLLGGDCLYGRYWGRVEDRAFLHFELCYYQAIEFAIASKLPRVEAGAQGEHKLARGYAPVPTWSAHWIAHPGLRQAVADYLQVEMPAIADEIETLAGHTPFRKGEGNPA